MYLAEPFYEDKGKREPNFAIVFNLRSFKSDRVIFSQYDSNRVCLELKGYLFKSPAIFSIFQFFRVFLSFVASGN